MPVSQIYIPAVPPSLEYAVKSIEVEGLPFINMPLPPFKTNDKLYSIACHFAYSFNDLPVPAAIVFNASPVNDSLSNQPPKLYPALTGLTNSTPSKSSYPKG